MELDFHRTIAVESRKTKAGSEDNITIGVVGGHLRVNGAGTHSNIMTSRSEHDATTEVKGELRHCAWPGCTKIGDHKAPVSKKKFAGILLFLP